MIFKLGYKLGYILDDYLSSHHMPKVKSRTCYRIKKSFKMVHVQNVLSAKDVLKSAYFTI